MKEIETIFDDDNLLFNANQLDTDKKPTSFLTPELVALHLPYRNPKEDYWKKESKKNKAILLINSGKYSDKKTGEVKIYGVPFGGYARIMLYYICNEIITKKNQYIEFGNSFDEVFINLGLREKGKRADSRATKLFKDQFLRLCNAQITLDYQINEEKAKEFLNLAKRIEFWGKNEATRGYGVKISDDFYKYIINRAAVPFDLKSVLLLKDSPMAMDLYIYMNHTAFSANKFKKDIFLDYHTLYNNMGSSTSLKAFKQLLKNNLIKVANIHPNLILREEIKNGSAGIVVSKRSCSNVRQQELFLGYKV